MVASQQKEIFRIFDLIREHQANDLQILHTSVDIVPQEKIIGLGREVTDFEDAEEVDVLSMNVTSYYERHIKLQKIWL